MSHPLPIDWDVNGNAATWVVPSGWGQGRALFGGLAVAAAVRLADHATDRSLRTVQTQFLGFIEPGPVVGHVEILREGKTTTFVEVRILQNRKLRAVMTCIFVVRREGSVTVDGPTAPDWTGTPAVEMPFIEGLTPDFTQHLRLNFIEGGMPFSGAKDAAFGGTIDFRKPSTQYDAAVQLVFLDAWPAPTIALLNTPVPASSMSWTAHLLASSAPGPHHFRYRTVFADAGVSSLRGELWDSEGTLVALTDQTAAVFDVR